MTVFNVADAMLYGAHGFLIALDRAVIEHKSEDFVFDFTGVDEVFKRAMLLIMSRARELRRYGSRVYGKITNETASFVREYKLSAFFEVIDSFEAVAA